MRILLGLVSLVAFGAITEVSIRDVTHTHAVMRWKTDHTSTCSVKIADMGQTDEPQPLLKIASASGNGTTVTITTSLEHVLDPALDVAYVENSGVSQWDGWQTITGVSGRTFTFANSTSGSTTPANGRVGWLVNDVNTNYFSGSDLDNRAGAESSLRTAAQRMMIIGRQLWDPSTSGRKSRALRANARHVYTITCGGSSATGEFTTNTIPLGNGSMVDWPRSHPSYPGEPINDVRWDPRGQSERPDGVCVERVIDPTSGTLVTNGHCPGQYTTENDFSYQPFNTMVNSPTGWTNTGNIIDSGSNVTTYQYPGSGSLLPLVLRPRRFENNAMYIDDSNSLVDSMRFYLKQASTTACTGTDCDIEVAFSIDGGINAYSDWHTITLTTTPTDYSFPTGSGTPKAGWQDWITPSTMIPGPIHLFTAQGSALVADGTNTVTLPQNLNSSPTSSNTSGSDFFKNHWVVGTPFRINANQGCTPQAITNTTPIEVTCTPAHNLATGTIVFLNDIHGNTAANGVWPITVTSSTKFTLDGSAGNGTWIDPGAAHVYTECLGGEERTVTGYTSQVEMTLSGSAIGAGTGITYCASQFGLMIRKKTTATNTISIQYANAHSYVSTGTSHDNSTLKRLSETPLADARGNLGYIWLGAINMYWCAQVNAECRYIQGAGLPGWPGGFTYFSTNNQNTTTATNPAIFFGNPNSWAIKFRYWASDATKWLPNLTPTQNSLDPCSDLSDPAHPVPDPCMSRDPQLDPYTFSDLILDFDSTFDPTYFTSCSNGNFISHYMLIKCSYPSQDTIRWEAVYDVDKDIANYIPGNPATNPIVAAAYSGSVGMNYSRIHFEALSGTGMQLTLKTGRQDNIDAPIQGLGPWRMDIVGGTSIDTSTSACPANTWGLTACSTIHVTSEPFVPFPAGIETGAPGEYGNVQEGQALVLLNCATIADKPGGPATCWQSNAESTAEYARIITKTGAAPDITLVIARGLTGRGIKSQPAGYHVFTAMLSTDSTVAEQDTPTIWDWVNCPHGGTQPTCFSTRSQDFSHGFVSRLAIGGDANGTASVFYNPTPAGNLTTPTYQAPLIQAPFAGKNGLVNANTVERYYAGNATDFSQNQNWLKIMQNSAPLYQPPPVEAEVHGFAPVGTYIWRSSRLRHPVTTEWAYVYSKVLPLRVNYGWRSLLNVSGVGATLNDNSGDWYKFCVVYRANECVSGSKPYEIYINVPRPPRVVPVSNYGLTLDYAIADGLPNTNLTVGAVVNVRDGSSSTDCTTGGGSNRHTCTWNGSAWTFYNDEWTGCDTLYRRESEDLCVDIVDPFTNMNVLYRYGMSPYMRYGRDFQKIGGFSSIKFGGYQAGKVFPDGKWMGNMTSPWGSNRVKSANWYTKLPTPPPQDSIDRLNWVPHHIRIGGVPSGASLVQVEYGYLEYGSDPATGKLNCTERVENCVATTATVLKPYVYADGIASGAAGYENRRQLEGITCTGSGTITCTLSNHGLAVGSKVYNGYGNCEIASVADANTFTIATVNGSCAPTSGSGITLLYFIEDAPFLFSGDGCTIAETSGNGVSPITYRCAGEHHLQTGQNVCVSGIVGNTAANQCGVVTLVNSGSSGASLTSFLMSGTGNGAYSSGGTVVPGGVSCSSGCTVSLATKSNQVMFWRPKFLSSTGAVVATGRIEVVTTN